MAKTEKTTIEWRDPPAKGHSAGRWERILEPLLTRPGRWAMIMRCKDAEQANNHQKNLQQRKVNIPRDQDDWQFAARGQEVFAIYRGKVKHARVRRTQRAR